MSLTAPKPSYFNTPTETILADCIDILLRSGCTLPADTKDPVALLIIACDRIRPLQEKNDDLVRECKDLEERLAETEDAAYDEADAANEEAETAKNDVDSLRNTLQEIRRLTDEAL